MAVAQHFSKGYSRANSVVNAGAGLGLMVFPPLFQLGIDEYGWRGMQLILAGIQGQLLVVGVILRHARKQRTTIPSKTSLMLRKSSQDDNTSVLPPDFRSANNNDSKGNIRELGKYEEFDQDSPKMIGVAREVDEETYELGDSDLVNLNHSCANADKIDSTAITNGTFSDGLNGIIYKTNDCTTIPNNFGSDEEINIINCNSPHYALVHEQRTGYADSCRKDTFTLSTADQETFRQQTFIVENEKDIESLKDMTCNNKSRTTSIVESISLHNLSDRNQCTETEDIVEHPNDGAGSSTNSCLQGLVKTSGWLLLRENVGFRFINFCQFMQGLCYTVIMTHFVASVVYDGIDEQLASYLLSVLGIASLLSRLCNGWVIDRKWIAAEHLYFVPMALFGGATLMCRVFSTYGW